MKTLVVSLTGLLAIIFVAVTGKSYNRAPPNVLALDSSLLSVTMVATGLDVPWEIAWGPDNFIWFTEQKGTVNRLDPATGKRTVLLQIPDVYKKKSYGLLGMALHPDFADSPYVFLDYTYLQDSAILSKLVRYTYRNGLLSDPLVLLKDLRGNTYHNGCRVVITPDRKIMMSTGDAGRSPDAQDTGSLNGKILRLNMDGTIPRDNPFPGSPVWSYGHRNPEGLVFGPGGVLYSSEHGDASDDEVNIISKGCNYGWPNVEGYCDRPEEKSYCTSHTITSPIKAWTPTIAPAGIDYYRSAAIPEWSHSLLLTTLKAASLRVLRLNTAGTAIVSEKIYFDKTFGRLRDLCIAPNGDIYLSTSNRDWNPGAGFPKPEDDRIIRLHKIKTVHNNAAVTVKASAAAPVAKGGAGLYITYCASCHRNDGKGAKGVFPPLAGSSIVSGIRSSLAALVLKGMSGAIEIKGEKYNQQMPSFRFLSDEDLASVLNYIRSHFGNHASAFTVQEMAQYRKR